MFNPKSQEDVQYWSLRAFFDEVVLFQSDGIESIIPPDDISNQSAYEKNFKGIIDVWQNQDGVSLANKTGNDVRIYKTVQHLAMVDRKKLQSIKTILTGYLEDDYKIMLAVPRHAMSLFSIAGQTKYCFVSHDTVVINDDIDNLLDAVIDCITYQNQEKFAISIECYKRKEADCTDQVESKFEDFKEPPQDYVESVFMYLAFSYNYTGAITAYVNGVKDSELCDEDKKELLLTIDSRKALSIFMAYLWGHAEAIKGYPKGNTPYKGCALM